MKRIVIFSLAMIGVIALSPDDALGQKKAAPGKQGNVSTATPAQYALLARYKEMVGTIASIDRDSVVLRVSYDHPVQVANANPQKATNVPRPPVRNNNNFNRNNNNNSAAQVRQQINRLQQDRIALSRAKNPADAQQKLMQLARDQQALEVQLYRLQIQQAQNQQQQLMALVRAQQAKLQSAKQNVKTQLAHDFIDFDLPFAETAKFRRFDVGVMYDEKGEVKEMAKAKDGLPGFPAKLDELVPGAQVKVYLLPAKAAFAAAPPPKKDDNNPVMPAPANLNGHPRVGMLVVLADPAAPQKKKAK